MWLKRIPGQARTYQSNVAGLQILLPKSLGFIVKFSMKGVLKLAWLVKMPTIVIWLKNNHCHFATLANINCSASDCTSVIRFLEGVIIIITFSLHNIVCFFLWQHGPCALQSLVTSLRTLHTLCLNIRLANIVTMVNTFWFIITDNCARTPQIMCCLTEMSVPFRMT